MSLRNTLNRLVRVVLDEAERNPRFEAELVDALNDPVAKRKPPKNDPPPSDAESKRGKNRREAAVLDPVQLVRDGEATLRVALGPLSLEQLRDIVAEYGMDQGRLVMKWATPERVIDRIVEMSAARAQKGNAFRRPAEASAPVASPSADQPQDQTQAEKSEPGSNQEGPAPQ